MKRTTVRIVAPGLILAGVVGYAAATGLPQHEIGVTPTESSPVRSAQSEATPSAGSETNQAAASAVGLLRIDYQFERQGRAASNQFAIWIETAAGEYVDTVFATSWIANGGWTRRPMSMPEWREASNWADATRREVESASRPAPTSGAQTVYWNGQDAQGLPVPEGDYVLRVEGNVEWERRVMFAAPFTVGASGMEVTAEETVNDQPEDTMITDVRAAFLPGQPLTDGMRTEFTRGS